MFAKTIRKQKDFDVKVKGKDLTIPVSHALTERHMDILLEGGVITGSRNVKVKWPK